MIRSLWVGVTTLKSGDAMIDHDKETILLICGDETDAATIMTNLYEADIRVVGPIHTARMALAMAAQTSPTLALLAGQPTGERKAAELAQAMMSTWGVRSMLLNPTEHDAHEASDWRAPEHQVALVRRALTQTLPSI